MDLFLDYSRCVYLDLYCSGPAIYVSKKRSHNHRSVEDWIEWTAAESICYRCSVALFGLTACSLDSSLFRLVFASVLKLPFFYKIFCAWV